MKTKNYALALLLLCNSLFILAQNSEINIYIKNGTTLSFSHNTIDSVTYSNTLSNNNLPVISTIKDLQPFEIGGIVIHEGGSNVIQRGIVWSTILNPTIENNISITNNGTGLGSFSTNINNLSANTTFYARAYATNSVGTAYGNRVSFFTGTYPVGTVQCNGISTAIVDVLSPITGKTWMDRNLGASRVATSINDEQAYGDLYQWGRGADGHQCRNSETTANLSSSDQPRHGHFIVPSNASDWRNPANNNLWQGVNGVNNPCPSGYRLPTFKEWEDELSISTNGFIFLPSIFKLTLGGVRSDGSVDLEYIGTRGFYWSSTISDLNLGSGIYTDNFGNTKTFEFEARFIGKSVRCIKNIPPKGYVNSLDCSTSPNNDTLTSGILASDISSKIHYTGANGGMHIGQMVNSYGVTGLTATLNAGNFAHGNGTLIYQINGTPSSSGNANFAIEIGSKTCILKKLVNLPAGSVEDINCNTAINNGILINGVLADRTSEVISTISYTGGNGGSIINQPIFSSGVSGLKATLKSINVIANGNGTLIYEITGTPILSGTANFEININGKTCTLSRTIDDGKIETYNCLNSGYGDLVKGVEANGVSFDIPYTNGNGGAHNGQTVTSTGVLGLTATLDAGKFLHYGHLKYQITGTPTSSGTASFVMNIGGQICNLTRTVNDGKIKTLNCNSSTNNGILNSGEIAIGINTLITYTGGNGGPHPDQIINSTGVTGLTATLTSGNYAYGNGSLIYNITGTPSQNGIASFDINIGGQTCNLLRSIGTINCNGSPTEVFDVTNPITGKIWMDRNLGASRVATSVNDEQAYGDLYQWGRRSDGHQCRNSNISTNLSSTDQPEIPNFIIISPWIEPYDWRNQQNNNLWQGLNGVNNPCPNNYRLPTITELEQESLNWTTDPFNSPLKLTRGGVRAGGGNLVNVGTHGYYWSSSINNTEAFHIFFGSSKAVTANNRRFMGYSIRCIKY